jgi:hypothetical protein
MTKQILAPIEAHHRFKPHGSCCGDFDGQVASVCVEGPFNVEGIEDAIDIRRQFLATIEPGTHFVMLVIWHGSVLMTRDALQCFEDTLRAGFGDVNRRPIAVAWVVPADVEGATVLDARFAKIYADAALPFRIFSSDDEARCWLRDHFG